MITNTNNTKRRGIALLVVLFIVATISVLSFGYVVKADRELSCAENTDFRTEMDYLGQTALNYAKALILNPQDVTTGTGGYWQGEENLRIGTGNDYDYYDVTVAQSTVGTTKRCTYDVTCNAFRKIGEVRVSETKLQAQLRLDPCIAYWAGANSSMPSSMVVRGDVYCNGSFASDSTVKGDVFANSFSGSKTGQLYLRSEVNVTWPAFDDEDFKDGYYYDDEHYASVIKEQADYDVVNWQSNESTNPAGIFYHEGDLTLNGNVQITGTLIVNGSLDIESGLTTITATKNYPAMIIDDRLRIRDGGRLIVKGLVHTETMEVRDDASDVTITGALFIKEAGIVVENAYMGNIIVEGDPMLSAIKIERVGEDEVLLEWMPVGGAYYKSIKRY